MVLSLKIYPSSSLSIVGSQIVSQAAPMADDVIIIDWMASQGLLLPIARYSLVICRNSLGRFLCVHERDRRWWIPGGGVNPKETHQAAAEREVLEETGIRVALKGILTFDQMDFGGKNNISGFRVIYYAEPLD